MLYYNLRKSHFAPQLVYKPFVLLFIIANLYCFTAGKPPYILLYKNLLNYETNFDTIPYHTCDHPLVSELIKPLLGSTFRSPINKNYII